MALSYVAAILEFLFLAFREPYLIGNNTTSKSHRFAKTYVAFQPKKIATYEISYFRTIAYEILYFRTVVFS